MRAVGSGADRIADGRLSRPADQVAHGPLVRKFSALLSLSNEEIDCLEKLHERQRTYPAKTDIIREGDEYTETMIVAEGWAIRYKMLSDGRR